MIKFANPSRVLSKPNELSRKFLILLPFLVWIDCTAFHAYVIWSNNCFGPLQGFIESDLNLTKVQFALISGSAQSLIYCIGQIFNWRIVNHFGLKTVFFIAVQSMLVSNLIMSMTHSFEMALVARLLSGVGSLFAFICLSLAVRENFSEDMQGTMIGASGFISALLGSAGFWVNSYFFGWREVFGFLAKVGLIILMVLALFPASTKSNSKPRKGRRFKIPSILTKDVFLMIYCAGVGFAVMQYFSNNELYNFLSIRELEHIPLMMSFLWVGNAFGCILSGFLIDRYGCYLDILRYYAMFAFVGILGILFLKAKWYFFLPFFFCLGIPASGYVVVVSYFNKYLSSTNGSSAVSLMDFFGGLACLIIPALMGMIFQYTVYLGPLNVQVYQHIFLVLVPIITLPLFIKLKP